MTDGLSQQHLAEIADVHSYNNGVIAEFRRTGGTVGGDLAGQNALLLNTVGAKSGQPRTTPLLYVPLDGDIYILGSFRGSPKHPAWVFNLRANPVARVEIGAESYDVDAVELGADDHRRVFDRIIEQEPLFAELRDSTARVIPIFELRRR